MKYGNLTVIYEFTDERGRKRLACLCDCGKYHEARKTHVTGGKIVSCGCHKNHLHALRLTTHGKSKTSLYRVYKHIHGRCMCKTDDAYSRYGGRGIKLCDEWADFEKFFSWSMENGYAPGLTIDRIDNNGNYSPDNCRWTTMKVQSNNKRNNHLIEFDGKIKTLAQWADEKNLTDDALEQRLNKHHWSIERALTTPLTVRCRA